MSGETEFHAGSLFRIHPVYGWGWFKGRSAYDVPPPFDCRVIEVSADGRVVTGYAEQEGRPLNGKFVSLHFRASWPDGEAFNLLVHEHRRSVAELLAPTVTGSASVVGHAMLKSGEE